MFRLSLFSLSFFSFFSQCGQSQNRGALPKDLPADLTVEYRQGGGMRPQSEGAHISLKESYFEYWYSQANNKIPFALTQAEMEQLYKVFVQNKFNKIRTRTEKVHDRGGTTITLRFGAGKENISVSDGGMTFIEKDWVDAYKNCRQAILNIIKEKAESQRKPFEVRFDASIIESGHLISFSIEDSQISYYSEQVGKKERLAYKILNGQHNFYMQLIANTEPSHQRKCIDYISGNFEKKSETKGIVFSFKEGKLVYKLVE